MLHSMRKMCIRDRLYGKRGHFACWDSPKPLLLIMLYKLFPSSKFAIHLFPKIIFASLLTLILFMLYSILLKPMRKEN